MSLMVEKTGGNSPTTSDLRLATASWLGLEIMNRGPEIREEGSESTLLILQHWPHMFHGTQGILRPSKNIGVYWRTKKTSAGTSSSNFAPTNRNSSEESTGNWDIVVMHILVKDRSPEHRKGLFVVPIWGIWLSMEISPGVYIACCTSAGRRNMRVARVITD